MPDRPLQTRRQLSERLSVTADFQRVTLTEDYRRAWRNLALVAAGCLLIAGGLLVTMANDRDLLFAAALVTGLLAGIPLLVATVFYFPWNRQVIIDSRDELCLLRRRFYIIPYRTVALSLSAGRLSVEQVRRPRVTRQDRKDSSGSMAFLSLLLGPLGLLITGFEIVSSIQRTEILAWGLVYRNRRDADARPAVLLACCSNEALLEAERSYSAWIH